MQWPRTFSAFGILLACGLTAVLSGCVLPLAPGSQSTTMPAPPILATRKDAPPTEPMLSSPTEALAWVERLHTLSHEELLAEVERLHTAQETGAADPMLHALQLALARRVMEQQETMRQLQEQGTQQSQQLQEQQKRLSALNQQLELLRSIERSLPVRSAPVGTISDLPNLPPPEASELAPLPAATTSN